MIMAPRIPTKARKKASDADIKTLYGRAAATCAFPDCRKELVYDCPVTGKTVQIGEIAHIVAHSINGPRGEEEYPEEKIDTYDNFVLLCQHCHAKVDALPEEYTSEKLRKIKNEHESWVTERLDRSMNNVTFVELQTAAKALTTSSHYVQQNFYVIPPEEKIQKNNLSEWSKRYIAMGLSRSAEVAKFISAMAQVDSSFPERLTAGFQDHYLELKKDFVGDELFGEMLNFATCDCKGFEEHAAGIAILVHLFHLCEIFEK